MKNGSELYIWIRELSLLEMRGGRQPRRGKQSEVIAKNFRNDNLGGHHYERLQLPIARHYIVYADDDLDWLVRV
mgnify:CR=1 FL=1